jgi:peptidoglycan hydrolase-like protein with peptidoglycan-binding domain
VRPGSVLLEVSGRPLIALPGTVPAYRDLRPGDDGTDIGQLQAALRSLGYYHGGDSAGHFGPGTKRAVTRLYAATDYDLATTGGHADGGDRAALQNAQDAVDAAQRAVDDLNRVIGGGQAVAPSPSAGASEPLPVQLRYLRRALTRARNAQADLIGRTGPMVPRAEIVFVSSFPAQVSQLAATVGAAPAAPLITLAAGALHVVAKLPPDQGRVLRSGMAVAISSEVVGSDVTGTITAVGPITSDEQPAPDSTQAGPATETGGQPGRPYVRVVAAPRSRLGPAWFGQDVRLTVTSARTADPVLVVPLSAVSAGADGRTTVSKISPGGAVSRIEVRAGMSGGGFVEITPISHPLVAGDRVLVGT